MAGPDHEHLTGDVQRLDVVQRLAALRSELRAHNVAYYQHDGPTIPDADYDQLLRELQALETQHPALVVPDSPSQVVGSAVSTLFTPVEHRVPMMSLDNAMDIDELRAWNERVARGLPDGVEPSYVCELKFDGLAVSIRYEGGRFVQAATRGNGRVGEDV